PSALVVNDTGDAGDASAGDGVCETASGNGICTLRAAIGEANASSIVNTINIQSGLGAINLTAVGDNSYGPSAFVISKAITINANGATIQRNSGVTRLRIFYVSPTGTLTLNDALLQSGIALGGNGGAGNANGNGENGGAGAGLGGAIFNEGTLNLNRSTLTGN